MQEHLRHHMPIAIPTTQERISFMPQAERAVRTQFTLGEYLNEADWSDINGYIQNLDIPFASKLGADRIKVFYQAMAIAPTSIQPLPTPTQEELVQVQKSVTTLKDELYKGDILLNAYLPEFLEATALLKLTMPTLFDPEVCNEKFFYYISGSIKYENRIPNIFYLTQLYPQKSPQETYTTEDDLPKYIMRLEQLKKNDLLVFAQEAAYLRLVYPEKNFSDLITQDTWTQLKEKLQQTRYKNFVSLAFAMTILAAEQVTVTPAGVIAIQYATRQQTPALPTVKKFI